MLILLLIKSKLLMFFLTQKNVSIPTRDSGWSTLTWISDLPLECVDHSVRIRSFCHQTAPGPWSNWVTNHGESTGSQPKRLSFKQNFKKASMFLSFNLLSCSVILQPLQQMEVIWFFFILFTYSCHVSYLQWFVHLFHCKYTCRAALNCLSVF